MQGMDSQVEHRIIVSGITGQVGRRLAWQLTSLGYKVYGLTRQALTSIPSLPSTVTLCRIDDKTETFCEIFQKYHPDTVIHLAALARRHHLATDITPFVEANILLGTRILEAMRHSGCRRFITAESILQFSADGELRPFNFYAATKQAFSDLLLYFTAVFDISAVALVLPTIYSEYANNTKLMTDIVSAALNSSTVTLAESQVRVDLVHVEDVAAAFVRAVEFLLESAADRGGLSRYCVSSGSPITSADLVALFERVGKRGIPVRKQPSLEGTRRGNPWSGPTLPGWVPRIDLQSGIARMLSRPHGGGVTS
jgi:nucleoside-diphosphate-sugar epimerase